ncbi:hypothetical protein HYS48_01780 [Candidatus Woesearchaeota archaeon]|nr:hypothetical protein [Candidatus Woesearchaeota archaeon]
MGNPVEHWLRRLSYPALQEIKKAMEEGNIDMLQSVEGRMQELEQQHNLFCSNCFGKINMDSTTTFTLVFGLSRARKKATFCALDCLTYFLENLKALKEDIEESIK